MSAIQRGSSPPSATSAAMRAQQQPTTAPAASRSARAVGEAADERAVSGQLPREGPVVDDELVGVVLAAGLVVPGMTQVTA